jgi:hypothetical protein
MELPTAELQAQLPPLYAQEENPDPLVYARFFLPDSNWMWLVTEGAYVEDDFQCFGYVIGLAEEWGYFLLRDLECTRGPQGQAIERDLHFTPAPFSTVIQQQRHTRGAT